MTHAHKVAAIRWLVIALFVILLEALCRLGIISSRILIPPSAMAVALYDETISGTLNVDALVTLRNVAIAFVLAAALGFVSGLFIHSVPRVRRVLEPFLASYYAIPTFVFYPILLAVLGMGDAPMIAIGTLFGIVAMTVTTISGMDRMPVVYAKSARVFGMSRLAIVRHIILPAIVPYLFTGIKLSIAYAFIGVIAAEFILSDRGLGYEISYAFNNFDNSTMYADILLILIIVSIVNAAFQKYEKLILERRGM